MQVQATAIAINRRAYLITGPSGSGKSALALALLHRGAGLIADDRVEVLSGMALAPVNHRGWLEVRNVGLVSGFRVCARAKVSAEVRLTDRPPERIPEPVGTDWPIFCFWKEDPYLPDKILALHMVLTGKLKKEY